MTFSRRSASEAISNGEAAETSSTKSARAESSSSPTGFSSEIGCWVIRITSRTSRTVHSSSSASSVRARLAAQLLDQAPFGVDQLVEPLDHVHGDPDRSALVGQRAGDRLADPPGRVGRELVAAAVVELLDRPDQAQRALLDQVQQRQAAADVALGDRDDQPQVGLDHVLLGGDVAALDPLRQGDLLGGASAAARARSPADRAAASPGSARRSGRPRGV